MNKVFYANHRVKDACESDPLVMDKIKRLINNECGHGDNIKKLHVKFPVYRIKTGDKGRIIFTYQDSLRNEDGSLIPIILELDENHKYDSKYLESGVYRSFFENNTDDFILALESDKKPEAEPAPGIQGQVVHIIGKETILFDEKQDSVTDRAIIEGPPGSGKTSVAFATLEKFALNNPDPEKKLLYVTRSQRLASHMRELWQESPHYQPGQQDGVNILSYSDLLAKFYPGLNFQSTAKEEVINFLLNTTGIIGKNLKQPQRQEKAELLYLEFRILSGLSEQEYLSASSNISHYPKDQRQQVIQAFKAWTSSHAILYPEFHRVDPTGKEYDIVVVDETQDFSHLETNNLMSLAKNKQCVFCLDPKQNLKDNQSKIVHLQNEFYKNPNSFKVEPVQLQGAYRCPPEIMRVAKKIDDLRLQLIPSGKQGAAINVTNHQKGNVTWLNPDDASTKQTLSDLKYNRDCFIVTEEKYKNELLSEGYSRVFTPEEIKGLQAKTVVLYKPLDADIFRKINASLVRLSEGASISLDENLPFGPALCSFFTATTRAQEHLIMIQKESEHLKEIIKPLKQPVQNPTPTVAPAVINVQESLKQAKYFYDNDHIPQAEAVLIHEVFAHDEKKFEKIQELFKQWSKTEPAKSPPPKVDYPMEEQIVGMMAISNFMASTDLNLSLNQLKEALQNTQVQLIVKGHQDYSDRVIAKLIEIAVNPKSPIRNFAVVVEILLDFDDSQLDALDKRIKKCANITLLQPALYKILKDFAEKGNKKAAHFMTIQIIQTSTLFDDPRKKVPYLKRAQEFDKIAGDYKKELRKNLNINEHLSKAETELHSQLTEEDIKKFEQYFLMLQRNNITETQLEQLEEFTDLYAFHNFYLKKGELTNKFAALLTSRFVHDYKNDLNDLGAYTLRFFQRHDPYEFFEYAKLLKLTKKVTHQKQEQMICHMVARAAAGGVEEAQVWMMESLETLDINFLDFEFLVTYCDDCKFYANELSTPAKNYVESVAKSINKINECGEFRNELHEIEKLFYLHKPKYQELLRQIQIQAIKVGHLYMVEQLILAGSTYPQSPIYKIDWNFQDPESKETLLHKLCSKRKPNYLTSLRVLVQDNKADVSIVDKRGLSAFAISALLKESEAINIMLSNSLEIMEKLISQVPERFSHNIFQFFLLDENNKDIKPEILKKLCQIIEKNIQYSSTQTKTALKN